MNSRFDLKILFLFCILIVVSFLIVAQKYLDLKSSSSSLTYSDETSCNVIYTNHSQHYHVFDGVQYPQYIPLYQNKSINFKCLNLKSKSNLKTILALNKFYGKENFAYGLGKVEPFVRNHCPIVNCELTNDVSKLNQSDFLLVSLTDKFDEDNLRLTRQRNKRYVSVILESQINFQYLDKYNGLFSFTADFKSESTFGINYESQKGFSWSLNETFNELNDFSLNKSGFMAGLISNCEGQHAKRSVFIEELRKYVTISVYGGCGIPCPKIGGEEVENCRAMIGRKYKFFLAAENSLCQDYITEKFFLMLKYDIVMVVYGLGNYTKFVSCKKNLILF
jgi:hypothetical protein